MKKQYVFNGLIFFKVIFLLLAFASCKKNNQTTTSTGTTTPTPTKLGLYEVDSSIYRQFLIPTPKIGTLNLNYYLLFDTGSGGMVMDAHGILPAAMITSSGFNFTGDSVIVDGITITNQTSTIIYGDDCSTTNDTVYGNLAYAAVTIGDNNGSIVIKRMPFFLYFKATTGSGANYPAHEFDVFGVNQENDFSFSNGVSVTSPLSYYNPGTGLTSGFKMAALGTSYATYEGDNYVPAAVTVGLTPTDLSVSSGFVNTQLSADVTYGYIPFIPSTISYDNKSFSSDVVFDSGTAGYSYIEDPTFTGTTTTTLPQNTQLSVATKSGFNYSYTISGSFYQTYVENPATSCVSVSILSIDYFLNNEYMLNYSSHELGLKFD